MSSDDMNKYNVSIYSYCLMRNHVHFLLKEKDKPISLAMKSINTTYAGYFNKNHNRIGHLFQDRFKSLTAI